MRYFSRPLTRHLLTLAVVCCIPLHVHSDVTWTGATSNITLSSNWGGSPPAGQNLLFGATGGTNLPELLVGDSLIVGSITFDSTDYTLSISGTLNITPIFPATTLTIDSLISMQETIRIFAFSANADVNINAPTTNPNFPITYAVQGNFGNIATLKITDSYSGSSLVGMTGDAVLNLTGVGSSVSFTKLSSFSSDSIMLGGGPTASLTFGTGGSTTNAGAFTGTGGITIAGNTQTFSGTSNTYSGPTIISTGATLEGTGDGTFSPDSIVTLNGTGVLFNNAPTTNTIAGLNSSSTSSSVDLGASGSVLTVSGPGTSSFAGELYNPGGLSIDGGQNLTLTGISNIYSGPTEIINGTLQAGGTHTLSTLSAIQVDAAGILVNSGLNTIPQLNGATGAQVHLGSSGSVLTLSGALTSIYQGGITDAGGLKVTNSHTLELTGSSATNYSGPTNVALLSTLAAQANDSLSPNSVVTIDSTSMLNINAGFNTIGGLAASSQTAAVNIASGTALTIGNGTAGSSTFAGIFAGAGDLTIANLFTLNLTGSASNGNDGLMGTTEIDGTLLAGGFIPNTLPGFSPIVLVGAGLLDLEGENNTIFSLASSSSGTQIFLGAGILTINGGQTTEFDGVIGAVGDPGGITLDGGNDLTLTNDNLYQGPTTIKNGSTLTLDSLTGNTISKSSSVSVDATSILALTTDNAINNPTGAVGSQFQLGNHTLTVNETSMTMIAGVISGTGGKLVMAGPNTLVLLGANTYNGGTNITGGTLQGNTTSLQGPINVNSNNLIFNQSFNGAFNGTLSSNFGATLTKNGTGVVSFNTSQAGYAGQTNVSAGTLNLNTILGGNMTVLSGGTLTGNGTIGGNLTINGGGTISPGNSIGTITVNGNYVQLPNSTYVWELLSNGQADLVNVHGTASIAGTLLITAPTDLSLNTDYLVLHADGGVTGTYTNPPVQVNPFISTGLIYTPFDVFYAFHTSLDNIAETFNQMQVANQIDSIGNPTADQSAFLNSFLSLSTDEAREALDEMSGDQHTYLLPLARYANESFRNGIYNAMRNTLDPCWCPDPCERFETWYRAEVGRFNGGGDRNCAGIHGTNWDMSIGAHGRLINGLQIGAAGNYQRNYVTYKQGGRTVRQTGQVAGYIVSRSQYGYFLGEAIYGNSSGSYRRPIKFGTTDRIAKSNPMTSQGLLYGEAAASFEYNFWQCFNLLFQPFVGAEFGMYSQSKIKEHGAESLDLRIRRHHQTTFDSLLGLHLTSGVGCVNLSADVVWQHRFDPTKIDIENEFENFGDTFEIKGCKFDRNGVRGNLRAAYRASRWIDVYADVSVDSWGNWTSYAVDAGINAWW